MKRLSSGMILTAALALGVGASIPTTLAAASTISEEAVLDLTTEEATKLAGFAVKLPTYVPNGQKLAGLAYSPKMKQVNASYMYGENAKPFWMSMKKADLLKESGQMTKIPFKKGTAYYGQQEGSNVLIWEEEKGVVYQMVSALTKEELVKIAESIGAAGQPEILGPVVKWTAEPEADLTLEEASKKFGYQVKVPKVLPEGTSLAYDYWKHGNHESAGMYHQISGTFKLSIDVSKGDVDPTNKEARKLGDTIYYIGTTPGWSYNEPERTTFNIVTWQEEAGIVYKISSSLSHDEMLKIAQSVE